MRYLSVCSGIEAASVAWHHLGWQPVGFSEIEPFPSAVLAHRFPDVPNFGDMTRHAEWNIGPGSVDLLVGGTPCQSFSVAGLRKGLSDPRGGLMLTYLEIAQRLRPRWIVWENVPGVLSSGSGRDLGAFLGALGELGYGWAYRVLDAQWVRTQRHPRAVPQRRRRLFVVGCFGDGAAAAQVLLERQSVCRDIEKSAKTRESVAADAEAGVGAGCWWDGGEVSQTLDAVLSKGQTMPERNRFPAVLQPLGYRWQNDREGLVEDGTAPACRASTGSSGFHEMNHPVIAHPVAFRKSRRAQSVNDHETCVAAEQANTLNQFDTGERDTHAVAQAMTVRRLTPRECERLQGFPDDWSMIPWRKKTAEECPDGPRYKALGNSMAVNVMAWIGERIDNYERTGNAVRTEG